MFPSRKNLSIHFLEKKVGEAVVRKFLLAQAANVFALCLG
jgi:hypothetical protein